MSPPQSGGGTPSTMTASENNRDWSRFAHVDIAGAADIIADTVLHTPLAPLASGDARIELRGKLENRQVTGAFKARAACHNIRQLSEAQRSIGVVACSSGNHGKALAWAAQAAGIRATIVMPADAYPNKIQACRDHGASVVLSATRAQAEADCAELVTAGWTLVHPYDAEGTIAGAGTVGLEIAADWPEVEVVIVPIGGGGLAAGTSLALRRALGDAPTILGAEPAGAPTMTRGLAAGAPVTLDEITTQVQGLCPLDAGALNIDVCLATLDGVVLLDDGAIFAAQARLVAGGEVVEPAGAAAAAVVYSELLPAGLLADRDASAPLRVAVVVSGGNPDPAQLEALRQA
ncbi:MAG: pyridoxal-phosphate dependent enzyme [Planctomycetota bacterium]|nr:MAG: pyridoxal-phosphate dependent enzyme [Planctomycetota bacterium]